MKTPQKQINNDSNRSSILATEGSWKDQSAQFINNSKEAVAQRALIASISDSPRMLAQRRRIEDYLGIDPPQTAVSIQSDAPIARQPVQRLKKPDDEEAAQPKFISAPPVQLERQPNSKPNHTGLPDNLKNGIEALSGLSMDNVKVHYDSSQPAQLNALAYAQGTDIHVAPGQERHLPHEAWHVVQQAQGRVRPTMQMKNGVPVNDDQGLEHEADVMGMRAVQLTRQNTMPTSPATVLNPAKTIQRATSPGLNRGDQVIVTNSQKPEYKKIGKVFGGTVDGYEVRFGPKFVTFTHADLDVAVTSQDNKELVWSTEEMEGLDGVAYKLFTRYSPNDYAYISLGSSPLLVIEYIRQRCVQFDAEDLLTLLALPLSEVDDEAFLDRVNMILSGDLEALSSVEEELQNLHSYMMKYVSPQKLDGKKPLLIDYAAGGRTLTVIRYHLMASYIYMGMAGLANSIEVVALNGGKDVITPTSSYRDLLSYYNNKDKIYDLFGQKANAEADLVYPAISTIDPNDDSSAFLGGLSNRKLKDEFGYRSWGKTSYSDVLKGNKSEGVLDEAGIDRARKAITQIINILDNFH